MTAIAIIALVTLAVSFTCSLLEAVLYAVTPTQLEVLRRREVFGARRFIAFREDVEEPIAAILTVNTIAHTVGAAWIGALAGQRLQSFGVGVVTAVFTLAVLLLTEIVPKSLGVRYARHLVPFVVLPLQAMVAVSWPIARPTKVAMSWLMRGAKNAGPTEEEIIVLSRMAHREGEVTRHETQWVENALLLDKVAVSDIMTPRTVVYSVPIEQTVDAFLAAPTELVHSRIPVYEGGDQDKITGLILRRDAFDKLAEGRGDTPLSDIVKPLDFIPQTMKVPDVLQRFLRDRRHMLAVLDEHGGLEGIVTLEDVLERLLGELIVDEHDKYIDLRSLAREEGRRRLGGSDPQVEQRQ